MKPTATLSFDLDNKWSYMNIHGDPGWESFRSYLGLLVPRVLDFLRERHLEIPGSFARKEGAVGALLPSVISYHASCF
jgi:hypothetical protein